MSANFPEPYIEIEDLSKEFPLDGGGRVQALSHVDLSIAKGEFISLVGPSGCGKSTLLRMMAGLLEPSSGNVRISGSVVDSPLYEMSVVFQQPRLIPWKSVEQNVSLPLVTGTRARRRSPSQVIDDVREVIELVGLGDFANSLPKQLSGGMQQRVAIARALVTEAELILMDEPFGALDAFTRERLNGELLDIWQSRKPTIVFVTHDIDEAVFMSDNVAVMGTNPGRILGKHPVGIPRPRNQSVRNEPLFYDELRKIRTSLYEGMANR